MSIEDFTLDLFFLQEAAHHLLPEPSITPFPWNTTPLSFENSSQILWNFESQLLGSSGATIVPSICKQRQVSELYKTYLYIFNNGLTYVFLMKIAKIYDTKCQSLPEWSTFVHMDHWILLHLLNIAVLLEPKTQIFVYRRPCSMRLRMPDLRRTLHKNIELNHAKSIGQIYNVHNLFIKFFHYFTFGNMFYSRHRTELIAF